MHAPADSYYSMPVYLVLCLFLHHQLPGWSTTAIHRLQRQHHLHCISFVMHLYLGFILHEATSEATVYKRAVWYAFGTGRMSDIQLPRLQNV